MHVVFCLVLKKILTNESNSRGMKGNEDEKHQKIYSLTSDIYLKGKTAEENRNT